MELTELATSLQTYLVLGTVLGVSLLTSLVKHVEFSAKAKVALATVFSWVAGVVVELSLHPISEQTAASILGTVLAIFGGSQVFYKFIMEGTTLEQKLAAVRVISSRK
jgi:hypothetical protein